MFLVFFGGFCFCLHHLVYRVTADPPGFVTLPALNDAQVFGQPTNSPTLPKTIVIDPGHGGEDPGTQGNGMYERQGTLPIALALARELRSRHYQVVLTREKDTTLSLETRSQLGNEPGQLCFVSVHLNYSDSPKSNGIETYYGWPKRWDVLKALRQTYAVDAEQEIIDQRSQLLAQSVHTSVLATTHASDREVKNNPNLVLLNSIRVPTILIECGFVSNKAEAEKVQTLEYQEKLAQGIADGIDKYLYAASGDPRYGIQIQDDKKSAGKK